MDISANDDTNFEQQKAPNIITSSSQWQVNAPAMDSFRPQIYAHEQNLGSFYEVNLPANDASTSTSFCPVRTDMFWTTNAMLRGSNTFLPSVPATIPPSLPHLPSDSSFIERAARFSCFSNIPGPSNHYPQQFQGSNEAFGAGNNVFNSLPGMQSQLTEAYNNEAPLPCKNNCDETKDGANECDEKGFNGCDDRGEIQGESSSKGHENGSKGKRKGQDMECEENKQRSIEAGDDNTATTGSTKQQRGKNCKLGTDPPKEGYIHIRARRGQATNSHSLAERVRREKISERMKFLQDLVPGCSKVTGKAVMLDEIINYVQSLQRQVEFLSMKLATVNPRLDFNLEALIAKDILPPPRPGLPPSSMAFPPNMHLTFPPLHHSQQGLVQVGLSSLCNNSSETLHRPNNLIPTPSGFKEAMSKVPNVWEDELHNVVHMGFDSTTSTPLNSQDLSGSVASGSMKAEQP